MAISMLKIRRPLGRLIFNMGIAIPGKTVFLIETAPWGLCSDYVFPLQGSHKNLWKKFHDFSMLKSKFPDTKYQQKLSAYLLLRFIYQFIESITDICMDIHDLMKTNQLFNGFYFARVETAVSKQKKLDTARRKASQICLH